MANSIINADSEGLKSTGGDGNTLILQTGGNAAITVNSTQVVTLAAPLPVASGGTGSNTGSGATLTDLNASSITSGTLSVNRIADSSITAAKLASGAAASNLGNYVSTVNGSTGAVTVQATLVSGSNIKTVNSTSLLGSGDVAVQATLVSGTNIKTVNNTSLLGSGNITVGSSTDLNGIGTTIMGAYQSNGSDNRPPGGTYAAGDSSNQVRLARGYIDGDNPIVWSVFSGSGYISGTWRNMSGSFGGGNNNAFWLGCFTRVS